MTRASSSIALVQSPRLILLVQLVRYFCGCGFVLCLKLFLSWLLLHWFAPLLAYLMVHVATFFVSYAIHARVTFATSFSWHDLGKYFSAVIGFKLLDYVVFTVLLAAWQIEALSAVLFSSVAIMLLRFIVVRRILHRHPK